MIALATCGAVQQRSTATLLSTELCNTVHRSRAPTSRRILAVQEAPAACAVQLCKENLCQDMAARVDDMACGHGTGGSKVEQTFASCKESAEQCHCIRNAACGTTSGTALRLASEFMLPVCGITSLVKHVQWPTAEHVQRLVEDAEGCKLWTDCFAGVIAKDSIAPACRTARLAQLRTRSPRHPMVSYVVPKWSLNAHKAGVSSRASRKLGRQGWQELRIELDCGACGPGKHSNSARPIWLAHVNFQGMMTESAWLCLRVCPCRHGADFASDAQIAAGISATPPKGRFGQQRLCCRRTSHRLSSNIIAATDVRSSCL